MFPAMLKTMTALESLKDATAKALVEAIENKHVAMAKQLFNIYYEVQQLEVPSEYQYNLDFDGLYDDYITGASFSDVIPTGEVTFKDPISEDILSL